MRASLGSWVNATVATHSGVAAAAGDDSGPAVVPATAWTVKSYSVPLVSGDTVQDVAEGPAVHPGPPVTTYPVMASVPWAAGVQETVAEPSPGTAWTSLGAPGGVGDSDEPTTSVTVSVVAARVKKLIPYDTFAVYREDDQVLVPEYVVGDDFRL